jgi:hypothetical protein
MKTTIIYVTPPQAPAEYLNWDAEPTKVVEANTRCQRSTGNKFFLVTTHSGERYLFEQFESEDGFASGQAWVQDKYGWQVLAPVLFNTNTAVSMQPVEAVFDFVNGEPILDSVTVIRPC